MKRRTLIKLRQLLVIVISWVFMASVISLYDHFVLLTDMSRGPSADYSFEYTFLMNVIRALIGGFLGGSFLVFYINVKFQDKPYIYTVNAVAVSFILIIGFISFTIGIIKDVLNIPGATFIGTLFEPTRMKNMVIWSVIVAFTQLFLQLNSKFGYGVFWNLLRGRYNTPKEEERIFMFLDINSSTTIAEKLGDEKYHAFLRDFYADITNPVLDSRGEIYQYVGDEVVIAWKQSDGIKENSCVKCFFRIRRYIEKNKKKYTERYGIVPTFKAGIHLGKVIVGEIGIIKRDITYSGNVLNTASRIQGKCKEFGADILASQDLISSLKADNKYGIRKLGAIELRGKGEKVTLSAIEPAL